MSFNPHDYLIARRVSERQLGRQQPDYWIVSTAKDDEVTSSTFSDDVTERMKGPPATAGRKRKNTSGSVTSEAATSDKKPRVSRRSSAAQLQSETSSVPSSRGKRKAIPKRTSTKRTSRKKDAANDADEQNEASGVLSPPETPMVSRDVEFSTHPSQDTANGSPPGSLESHDHFTVHQRQEKQLLTPDTSHEEFEIPRKQDPSNTSQDSPTPAFRRTAITQDINQGSSTSTVSARQSNAFAQVDSSEKDSELPDYNVQAGCSGSPAEISSSNAGTPTTPENTTDNIVPESTESRVDTRVVSTIEQYTDDPASFVAAEPPAGRAEVESCITDTQAEPGQDRLGSIALSSGLSSPPSGIDPPKDYMRPDGDDVPRISRPRRNTKPIQRYGGPVEPPVELMVTERETSYEATAEEQDLDDAKQVNVSHTQRSTRALIVPSQSISVSKRTAKSPKKCRVLKISLSRKSAVVPSVAAQNEKESYQELESTVDSRLIELSLKLTKREPLRSKPHAKGEPDVWADSRQALCETVPYFKKPQGGCHQNDRHTYAFLFDNVGHCREYMDSDVIVARAGGSMEFDSSTGGMIQKKDHLMSEAQVQSVINDTQLKNPLVIICGDKNQGAVCKMPHRYNVLGWYKPIDVWAEKTRGKGTNVWTTIKYRFERLGSSAKTAWHETASIEVTDEERNIAGPLIRRSCRQCQRDFPIVYLLGWMCLSQDCPSFWRLSSGVEAGYGKLHYNPAFLLHRTAWPVEEEPFNVRPPIPNVGSVVGDNLTKINTRGICCPQCGRCSSRRLFKGWRCDNAGCDFENFPKHIPVKIPMLHLPWESTGDGPALARNKHEKGVNVDVRYVYGFKVYTYTFEGIKGKFVHAASNAAINRVPGGANEMFTAIQNQDDPEMDMHLERRRFGIEKNSGNHAHGGGAEGGTDAAAEQGEGESGKKTEVEEGDFMTAFSMNYGMPYKFVASGSSMPFANAPWPVRACRADLNWASQTFLNKEDHVDLNEELIFAYLEGQKIEYHDDGESGLGPRITTLSLGGKARMHMRMKMKHHTGCSKTGILTAEHPVPGGIGGSELYRKRLDAWNEVQTLKDSNKPLYERRRKEIPKELGLFAKRMKKAEDAVVVTLNHGDIVAMEGDEIQQYLEHKVVPEGPLRFALTCRTVLPDHLKPEERPSYEVEADDESMSSLRRMAAAHDQQAGRAKQHR